MYQLVACAIFKNEGKYLSEWLDFHLFVGFEHFFLYNNDSSDNYKLILEKYIEKGKVTLINYPGIAVQLAAYNDCLIRAKDSKWIAFLDIDEFLFSPKGLLINEIESYSNFGGLAVNWVIFGSSGLSKTPNGSVIKSYKMRGELNHVIPYPHLRYRGIKRFITSESHRPMNTHIKSIVMPSRAIKAVSPHHFEYHSGFYAVDELKNKVQGPWTKSVSISRFRINHYWSKSLEEMLEKFERGRADNGLNRDWNEFILRDSKANCVEDNEIVEFIKKFRGDIY